MSIDIDSPGYGAAAGFDPFFPDREDSLKSLHSPWSLYLNNALVEGDLSSDRSIRAEQLNIGGNISVGEDLTLHATNCVGLRVLAGGSIQAINSTLPVVEADSFQAFNCPRIESITALSTVALESTVVLGNVHGLNVSWVKDSTIGGVLACEGRELAIENSSVGRVYMKCLAVQSQIQRCHGRAGIVVQAEKRVTSSGATIVAASLEMDFMPIWTQHIGIGSSPIEEPQTLTLYNSSVEDVDFEGRAGEVILMGDSFVTGEIRGGRIHEPQG